MNERLWTSRGTEISEFGLFLETILDKLEPFNKFMVFRGTQETYCDVQKYIKAYQNKTTIIEYAFLSASKFQVVAQGFGRVLFRIYGRNGKSIEKISKFEREKEILFKRNTSFRVLNVSNDGFSTVITLKEIKNGINA